jgi:gliding motility-associated-like protein
MTLVDSTADNDSLWVVISNSGLVADTLEVSLSVISQLGLSDDTTRINSWIVNPLPVNPTITVNGASCPGDTVTFTVDPYSSDLSVTWGPSSISRLIYQADAESIVLVHPDTDYSVTAHLTNNITRCENLVDATELMVINQAPVIVSIDEPAGPLCPFTAANSSYTLNATVLNTTAVEWTSLGGEAIFFPDNDESTNVSFNASNDTVWVVLEAMNSSCASSDFDTIALFIDTSYNVNYRMEGDIVCLEDEVTYSAINLGEDPITGNVTYTWVLNQTDTISTSETATITNVEDDEFLELFVEGDFCYSGLSVFYDSLNVPYITRPGGVLVLSGTDVEYDGIEDYYVLDGIITLDEDAVELEDDLNAADRFTLDLSDPTLWQFFWLSAADSLIYDGEEGSIDNYVVPDYPAITDATPPNWNAQNYDVTYYMITTNGTCYDTSTAVLHVDFDIFIPNVFTPNDDGYFDTWTVENGSKYGPLDVQIYNRWGNLVYNSTAWDNAWTGVNNDGEVLPFGTYFYILETAVEGAPVFRGTVTILK